MKRLNIKEVTKLKCEDENRYFILMSAEDPHISDRIVGKYILVAREVDSIDVNKNQKLSEIDFTETYFAKLEGNSYRYDRKDWINVKLMDGQMVKVYEIH